MRSMSDAPQRTALAEQQRLAIVDDAAIDAHPADLSREPAIFNFGAAIHDHSKTGFTRLRGGVLIDHAQLHPDRLESEPAFFRERLFNDTKRRIGAAENVDHVDGRRHVLERGVSRLSENLFSFNLRIDGNDDEALVQK